MRVSQAVKKCQLQGKGEGEAKDSEGLGYDSLGETGNKGKRNAIITILPMDSKLGKEVNINNEGLTEEM